jgi:hypothetical protein
MTLPVTLEPMSDDRVHVHGTDPMPVSAAGEEGHEEHPLARVAGLLKDHPLLDEWQQAIQEYRRQRDPEDHV